MRTCLALLLFASVSLAQPARMKVLQWDFPSNEVSSVFFWVERKESIASDWVTMSVVDPSSRTNAMAFFRVGIDWRTNAPSWMTNFQFMELPPSSPKAKAPTAGSKTGKLPTVKLPPKTFRAVMPPMPKL